VSPEEVSPEENPILGIREIGRRAGLHASAVSRILGGKRTSARLDTVKRIADVLGMSIDTVYRIMQEPELRKTLQEGRGDV
jgi:transcriptional regulator with XRE-family HTH domain